MTRKTRIKAREIKLIVDMATATGTALVLGFIFGIMFFKFIVPIFN